MSKPMLSFAAFVAATVLVLGGARAASAQQVVKLGEGETLTISGFISATLFNDRGLFSSFGQGQNELKDRKSTRLNSSHVAISYAVFCLKKKKKKKTTKNKRE